MNKFERRVWTSDDLSLFVAILILIVVSGALTLLGWCVNLLGGLESIKLWMTR